MERRRFVVIEGVPGVGKSTLAAALADEWDSPVLRLADDFRNARRKLEAGPGGTPMQRLELYLGAMSDLGRLVDQHPPHGDVLCDRYFPSPMGMFEAEGDPSVEMIVRVAAPHVAAAPRPTITVVLGSAHPTLRHRLVARAGLRRRDTAVHRRTLDDAAFAERWARAIERHARAQGPVLAVDTTHMSPRQVAHQVLSSIAEAEP